VAGRDGVAIEEGEGVGVGGEPVGVGDVEEDRHRGRLPESRRRKDNVRAVDSEVVDEHARF
jgi:hypothetical protein